jgi:hypothetical protein
MITTAKKRTWVAIAICLAAMAVVFTSCSPTQNDGSPNDVYVAGSEYTSQAQTTTYATLWINGTAQHLSDGSKNTTATSVYVTPADDVYVAGYQDNGTGINRIPKLWKNGIEQNLDNAGSNIGAYSVCVSGNNVYVAGDNATLWMNGKAQQLPIYSTATNRYAFSVTVDNNKNVYVGGTVFYPNIYDNGHQGSPVAKVWKNGVPIDIPDSLGWGKGICTEGNDVYLVGQQEQQVTPGVAEYKWVAVLWAYNKKQNLSNKSRNASAESVYVLDSTIYVAGYEYDLTFNNLSPKLWKIRNGIITEQPLNGSGEWGLARCVFLYGNDVYVAGNGSFGIGYWKNGNPIDISNKKVGGSSFSVFVK